MAGGAPQIPHLAQYVRSKVEAKRDLYWHTPTRSQVGSIRKNILMRYLAEHNYRVPTRLNHDELYEHVVRVQRGLRSVFGLQIDELQAMLVACGRPKEDIAGLTKRDATALLMREVKHADENKTFDKLLDLPGEIQVMIFHYVVADLPPVLTTPAQHPLARVNRQLRAGFLPVFYKECTFKLALEPRQVGKFLDIKDTLNFTRDSADFLNFMLPKDMAQIRKFEMDIPFHQYSIYGGLTVSFAVALYPDTRDYDFKWIGQYDPNYHGGMMYLRERRLRSRFLVPVRAILKQVVEGRDPGIGPIKKNTMTVADFYKFRTAIEEILRSGPCT